MSLNLTTLIQQVLEGISKLWKNAKEMDRCFDDKQRKQKQAFTASLNSLQAR